MSAPYDRPAYGDPGGCDCIVCGRVFVGAPWHDVCGVCAAIEVVLSAPASCDTHPKDGDVKQAPLVTKEPTDD